MIEHRASRRVLDRAGSRSTAMSSARENRARSIAWADRPGRGSWH